MQDNKIDYMDGTSQTLKSNSPKVEGEWMVFTDGSGIVLTVRAADVAQVSRVNGGISERK